MKRVCIVGCSGAGKSSFARLVGERLGLPVIHLDVLFWRPGWVESEPAAFLERTQEALAGDAWVTDGNFTAVAQFTFGQCDTILWLEQPIALCLWRAIARALRSHGRDRADMARGCAEKIDLAFYGYILGWNWGPRRRLQAAIERHGAQASLMRLRGDRGVAQFLAAV